MDLKKKYKFKEIEPKIKKFWEDKKIFSFDGDCLEDKKVYSIDMPPPTVSGKMHIGHAFSYSQQDFVARFWRMYLAGEGQVFYPFGTDDNGLPTERLIEKTRKIKSKDMERGEFIDLCLKTLKDITPGFIEDWKRIGVSADYNFYYSTIDENSRKISQQSFIDLYNDERIYKKEFPTIWCPECQTAIAQAELEDKELESLFSTLKFKVKENEEELLIATTRPELLPACVAVFVNPNDKRAKELKGKTVVVPLFNIEVPILEDESADLEKGTGLLMICSYGDKFDVDAIQRHKLSPRLVINSNGIMNSRAGNYEGLSLKEARKSILNDLEKEDFIVEQKKINHAVNLHDKCGTPIEFYPTEQWFIKILDKKKELIEQGKKINWHPEFMFKRYENWINGLEWDWSISRNRHFGIPIPVWNCKKCGNVLLPSKEELPVDPLRHQKKCLECGADAEGEKMVLDTWATSSLTPIIASSLVNNKVNLPFSLRPQAHDIIRTWAFYTIAKAYFHKNEIPWKDIAVSGFVTLKGEKMSKSKGNVVSPDEVIEEFGADAMRFWAASSKLGEDLDYQEQDLVAGKKMIKKLWNAAKFVFMNLEDYDLKKPEKLEKIDLMFFEKLDNLIDICTESFKNYSYSKAKLEVENFFWHSFADNYLEIVKKRIYNETGDRKKSAQYTLYNSLLTLLKLVAPIMPFVTEEIYQEFFNLGSSIHLQKWPKKFEENEEGFDFFVEILSRVRQEKTNAKKSMNSEIELSLEEDVFEKLGDCIKDLEDVTNAKKIKKGKFRVEFLE